MADNGVWGLVIAGLATTSVAGLIAGVVAGIFGRRKMSAEATQIVTSAGAGIAQQVEGYVERISKENARLNSENEALKVKVDDLSEQVRELRRELSAARADLAVIRHATEHPNNHTEGQTE